MSVAFIALGFMAAGGFGAWVGLRDLWKWWLVRTTPTVAAADAREGRVELRGRARAHGETLTAPLTGRECLAYHFKVEKRSNDSWFTLHKEERTAPFLLEDDSGGLTVDPEGAELDLHDRTIAHRGDAVAEAFEARKREAAGKAPEESTEEWLRRLLRGDLGRRRYLEVVLAPDAPVYVMGRCAPGDDGRPQVARRGRGAFFVSDRASEDALGSALAIKGAFLSLFCGFFVAVGVWLLVTETGIL